MLWMNITVNLEGAAPTHRLWALQDLPPFRPVLTKIMRLTADEDVPMTRVQDALRSDAVFAAEVLRLANSPLMSVRCEITSILQAVMMLGLGRIKALATTLALRTFLTSGRPTDALRACWRHNLATALLCERLARFVQIDSATCYTAGLLHDLGRLALLRASPDLYKRILSKGLDNGFDLLQSEKSLFGIDHCEAGEWILNQWGFPQELCEVVAAHHQKPVAGSPGLLPVVNAAWRMADLLGFSVLNEPVLSSVGEIAGILTETAQRQFIEDFDWLAEEVAIKIN